MNVDFLGCLFIFERWLDPVYIPIRPIVVCEKIKTLHH